jgi:hypothetical protein
LIGLLAMAACADFDSGVDPAFGLPDVVVAMPSFSADIQPILDRRCVVGGCHTLATGQADLTLDRTVSYVELVNVPSTLNPAFDRVVPGDAANSWLARMIGPDPSARDGNVRMPLASPPLTANQIQTIINWIQRGAPDD